MSSSVPLPSPDDDYTAHDDSSLTLAFWNAALNSVGRRIRALEAVKADWQALIAAGTGQALEVISANVEPQLAALNGVINALKADVAAAEDAIATIVAGGINMANVVGLSAALALKANVTYVDNAIAALVASSPSTLDTLNELATALGNDPNFATTVTNALGARLRIDAPQVLTNEQKSALQAALGVPSSKAVTAKASKPNRIINPAHQICQDRSGGASVDIAGIVYAMDGVNVFAVGGGVLTCRQAGKVSPGGSPYRFRASVFTADAALAAGDGYGVSMLIEGIDVADLQFGTANAKSFVWRGVVNLPVGTYGLSFANSGSSRTYVTTFTIAAAQAGSDVLITQVVPGDTSGTWIKDTSGAGLDVRICFGAGSNYQTPNTGVWQSGNYMVTPAQTNAMATAGATFELADTGLYDGTELPAWEMPSYLDDLRKCRSYLRVVGGALLSNGAPGWGGCIMVVDVGDMRPVTPAISVSASATGGGWSGTISAAHETDSSQRSIRFNPPTTQTSGAYAAFRATINARL